MNSAQVNRKRVSLAYFITL